MAHGAWRKAQGNDVLNCRADMTSTIFLARKKAGIITYSGL